MIVRCPDCLSKYEIAAARVPEEGIRVRCPKCKAVFPVNRPNPEPAVAGTLRDAAAAGAPSRAPQPEVPPGTDRGDDPAARPRRRITDPVLAKRLARAICQEVLLPRQEEHRRAVESGSVLSTFGPAIVSAFALYGEKVAADLPGAERIFREAVNDVLGAGSVLF